MKRPPQHTPHDDTADPRPAPRAPRPYSSPVLTVYGSLARLTESGGATLNEGSSGRMRMGMAMGMG